MCAIRGTVIMRLPRSSAGSRVRMNADARSVARSAPTRPPSARYVHSAYAHQEGPAQRHERLSDRQWSRATRPAHGQAPSPRQCGTTPVARLAPRLTEEAAPCTTTFRDLGILPETAEALEAVGITSPFPIQEMTLPVALSGTRRHRPGQDRHRQDAGLRPSAPGARHRPRGRRGGPGRSPSSSPTPRRPSSSSRPASCASRSPTTC